MAAHTYHNQNGVIFVPLHQLTASFPSVNPNLVLAPQPFVPLNPSVPQALAPYNPPVLALARMDEERSISLFQVYFSFYIFFWVALIFSLDCKFWNIFLMLCGFMLLSFNLFVSSWFVYILSFLGGFNFLFGVQILWIIRYFLVDLYVNGFHFFFFG